MTTPDRELTSIERDILDLEASWWTHDDDKEAQIRARFGMHPTRYYLVLSRLIDRPAALRHDPLAVRRLRRLRGAGRQAAAGSPA